MPQVDECRSQHYLTARKVLGSQSVLGNTYISTTVYPHTLKTLLTLFLLQNKIKIPTFWKGTSVLLWKLKNFPEEKFNPKVLKIHQEKTKSRMGLLTHTQHLEMWQNGCQAQRDEVPHSRLTSQVKGTPGNLFAFSVINDGAQLLSHPANNRPSCIMVRKASWNSGCVSLSDGTIHWGNLWTLPFDRL